MDNQARTEIIRDFVNYAQARLGIERLPKIVLVNDQEFAVKHRSFGSYAPGETELNVYIRNRNLADVLRTLAHELVHHRQHEKGVDMDGNTGSEIENEANSLAGVLMRDYGKQNKYIYENGTIRLNSLLKEMVSNAGYKVYFDFDDTLTNYTYRLRNTEFKDPETGEMRPITSRDTVDNYDFWADAEWLPGAEQMFNFARNNFKSVAILSAMPVHSKADQQAMGKRFRDSPINGKTAWLDSNVGPIEKIWTSNGKEKALYATANSILIDDKPENIEAFENAGGIGILMDNPSNVIKQLMQYA